MAFGECKVYSDGSHYIAIPPSTTPKKRRHKPPEEQIVVMDDADDFTETEQHDDLAEKHDFTNEVVPFGEPTVDEVEKPKKTRTLTKQEYFEELYGQTTNLKRRERKAYIVEKMRPYFKDLDKTKEYVKIQFDRKLRNLICRRVRLSRKTYLANFNYFCTFTYDGSKHTEESFRRKLMDTFKKMVYRRNWKYEGVWERSPEKKRLHFHGLFEIPDGTMPGELITVKDYSPFKKKVQVTNQSTYFNERFGRTTFEELDTQTLGAAIAYLIKYIEKTGEKIVYSKNLPQYFISDIMDEDVVCTIGQEDKKLLLFDNFNCWDEGCLMGQVSPEVIKQMRKAN